MRRTQAVVDLDGEHLGNDFTDLVGVVGHGRGAQVDVSGGSARVEGGEEHAALQHEPIGVGRAGEPIKEAFERIELVELIGRPA